MKSLDGKYYKTDVVDIEGMFRIIELIPSKNAVIGNSTEVKNSILFDCVICPLFNYVGDSILGENAHTRAGVIQSNVRSDKKNVRVKSIETNLRKM